MGLRIISLWVGFLTVAAGEAAADCVCLYRGGEVKEGQTACINTVAGNRLARCGKVLNNTSWFVTDQACVPVQTSDNQSESRKIAVAEFGAGFGAVTDK